MFDGLLAPADDIVDVVYAETFDFLPMREVVNAGARRDETRSPITGLKLVFNENAYEVTEEGLVRRVTGPPILFAQSDLFTQGVKRLDRFTRLKTGTIYEVSSVKPDGFNRSTIHLVEVVDPYGANGP